MKTDNIFKMQFKKLHENFELPKYQTPGAAAFDLAIMEDIVVDWEGCVTVGLGFSAAVPDGYVALILPRSSKGFNDGLFLANTCGVIDSDYRGEWKAKLSLHEQVSSNALVNYKAGERLLQCVIVPAPQVELELVDELSSTERGEGGIGSTGK